MPRWLARVCDWLDALDWSDIVFMRGAVGLWIVGFILVRLMYHTPPAPASLSPRELDRAVDTGGATVIPDWYLDGQSDAGFRWIAIKQTDGGKVIVVVDRFDDLPPHMILDRDVTIELR